MTVKFKQWHCAVIRAEYGNGVPALLLVDAISGEPIAKATVNIPDMKPEKDHVFIKDWSENQGMMKALINYKVIHDKPVKAFPFNRVQVYECKLTSKALKLPIQGK